MLFRTPRVAAQPLAQWRPTPMAVLCPFLRMGACPQPLVPCMAHVSCSSAPNSTSNIKLERMDSVPALPGRRFFLPVSETKVRARPACPHAFRGGGMGEESPAWMSWQRNPQRDSLGSKPSGLGMANSKKHNNQDGIYSTQSAMKIFVSCGAFPLRLEAQ